MKSDLNGQNVLIHAARKEILLFFLVRGFKVETFFGKICVVLQNNQINYNVILERIEICLR